MPGRGSWLAAHNLAVVAELLGDTKTAAELRQRHPAPLSAPVAAVAAAEQR